MIRLFQRLLLFSGLQKKRLIRSFLAYLVSSFFEMIPIMAILTVLTGILKQLSGDVMPESTIWISLGIMIVSIAGRIVFSIFLPMPELLAASRSGRKSAWRSANA